MAQRPHQQRIPRQEAERGLDVIDVVGIAGIGELAVPEAVPVGKLAGECVVAHLALDQRQHDQREPCSKVDQDRDAVGEPQRL